MRGCRYFSTSPSFSFLAVAQESESLKCCFQLLIIYSVYYSENVTYILVVHKTSKTLYA
jgi:hypothetical protein